MASHFSSIGLVIDSVDEMLAVAERAAGEAEVLEVEGGRYLVWSSGEGPELWLQLDDEDNLIGMAPHYAGRNRWRVALVDEVERNDQTVLDGSFYAWNCPEGDDPEEGLYPFVFDCPDRSVFGEIDVPLFASVQLAAFAHGIELWDDVDAYDETTRLWAEGKQLGAAVWQVGQLDDPAQITAAAEVLAEARKKIYRMLAE